MVSESSKPVTVLSQDRHSVWKNDLQKCEMWLFSMSCKLFLNENPLQVSLGQSNLAILVMGRGMLKATLFMALPECCYARRLEFFQVIRLQR